MLPETGSLDFNGPFTIDLWFNPNPSTPEGPLVSKYDLQARGIAYELGLFTPELLQFGISCAAGNMFQQVTVPGILQAGFVHVAAVFNPPSPALEIYVNGVLQSGGTQGFCDSINQIDVPFRIGKRIDSVRLGEAFFHGLIDEVEVFDRALTASEIQAIYNAGSAGKCKANSFAFGDVFVGTLAPSRPDNKIYRISADGNISVFAAGIFGGVRSLAFDPQAQALYALVIREPGSTGLPPSKTELLRFDSQGQASIFAELSPLFPTAGETDLEIDPDGSVFITGSSNIVFEITNTGNVIERFRAGPTDVIHALEFAENGDLFLGERGGDVFQVDLGPGTSELFATVPLSNSDIDFQGLEFTSAGVLIAVVQDFSQPNNLFSIDSSGLVTGLAGINTQIGTVATGANDQILVTTANGNVEVFSSAGIPIMTFSLGRQLSGITAVLSLETVSVPVDIKPGSDPNAINPRSRGVIPVAILTTDTFDATTVHPSTVQFGPDGATDQGSGGIEDVDGDGDLDLVLHFRTQETGIVCGDTEASLSGQTFGGLAIEGADSIVTVGCK